MNTTLDYYNKHANSFTDSTVNVDFKETQSRFLKFIAPGGQILDFGCGSGRDTKYFIENGYKTDAIDGSAELCKIASAYTGIEVKQRLFQDLDATERYDGIWACASILHLKKSLLPEVMEKMSRALKTGGVIYTSFKYGEYEGLRHGRYFTDFTEYSFAEFLKDNRTLKMEEYWITSDVRPNRGEEKWLNLILRKRGSLNVSHNET